MPTVRTPSSTPVAGVSAVSVVSVVSVDAVVSVAAGVAVVELAQAAMLSSIRAARTRARILLIVFIHLSFFIFPDRLHKSNKKVGRFCKAIHGMNRKRNSPPLPLPSIALHKVFLCDSPADLICRANTAGTGSACGISAVSPFPNGHCLCLPPGTFEARASIWNDCLDYSVSLCICKAKFSLESKNIFPCFCAECIRRRFFLSEIIFGI